MNRYHHSVHDSAESIIHLLETQEATLLLKARHLVEAACTPMAIGDQDSQTLIHTLDIWSEYHAEDKTRIIEDLGAGDFEHELNAARIFLANARHYLSAFSIPKLRSPISQWLQEWLEMTFRHDQESFFPKIRRLYPSGQKPATQTDPT